MKRIAVLLFGVSLAVWSTGCCCLSHLCGYSGGGGCNPCNPCQPGYGAGYGGGFAPSYGGSPCGPGGCGVGAPTYVPQGAFIGGMDSSQACLPTGGPMGTAMHSHGPAMAHGATPFAPGPMTAGVPQPIMNMPGGPVPHTAMAGPIEALPTY